MRIFRLSRNGLLLLAAIAAGLAAAWFARRYIQDHIRALDEQAKVRTVSRIVADFDLPEGLRLERLHLAVMQVPASWAPSGSIAPEEVQSIEGKVVTTAVRRGDILLRANLAPQRHQAFSQKVRSGRRAITIPVDAINSVSGMLVPGDLIDLYVSFEYRRKRITAPLLQGVLVLATGSDSQQAGQGDEPAQGAAVFNGHTGYGAGGSRQAGGGTAGRHHYGPIATSGRRQGNQQGGTGGSGDAAGDCKTRIRYTDQTGSHLWQPVAAQTTGAGGRCRAGHAGVVQRAV